MFWKPRSLVFSVTAALAAEPRLHPLPPHSRPQIPQKKMGTSCVRTSLFLEKLRPGYFIPETKRLEPKSKHCAGYDVVAIVLVEALVVVFDVAQSNQ